MNDEELIVFQALVGEMLTLRKNTRKITAENIRLQQDLKEANLKIARLESEAEIAKGLADRVAALEKDRDGLKRKLGALTMCFQREIGFKKEGGVKTLKVENLFAAIKKVIEENDIRLVDDWMAE